MSYMGYLDAGQVVILRREDLLKLFREPKILRDELIMELGKGMGLRSGEIRTVRCERVNLDSGLLYVRDSKNYHVYPLPMSLRIAELIEKYMDKREEGWLLRPLKTVNVKRVALGQPLSRQALADVVKHYARKAGIPNWREYQPRMLRYWFAAEWVRRRRNIEVLRRILRHKSLTYTQIYVSKLIFWEDVKREYDSFHALPIERRDGKKLTVEMLSSPIVQQCSKCPAKCVCRHVDEAINSEWASGCKFFPRIVEEVKQ